MPIVSNSNMETMQKCERMFYYAVVKNLTPKTLPIFLKRGSFGHDCMETGFQVIIDGGSPEEAAEKIAEGPLKNLMESGDPDAAEMMKIYRHVISFISWAVTQTAWRPVALEDRGMWNLDKGMATEKEKAGEDLVFGYTPDLIVEFTSGLYRGQHAVLDYKFLGQYMKEAALEMSQQIMKYMIYRNKTHTDFKIHRGAFVQLNTRAAASDTGHKLFLVKWQEPNKARLARIEYENEILAKRVADLRVKEPDEFIRTLNKNTCDMCFFTKICQAEFDGKSDKVVQKIIDQEFKLNDYGY